MEGSEQRYTGRNPWGDVITVTDTVERLSYITRDARIYVGLVFKCHGRRGRQSQWSEGGRNVIVRDHEVSGRE